MDVLKCALLSSLNYPSQPQLHDQQRIRWDQAWQALVSICQVRTDTDSCGAATLIPHNACSIPEMT